MSTAAQAAPSALRGKPRITRSYNGPSCPHCELSLDPQDRRDGNHVCKVCHVEFRSVAFSGRRDPGPTVMPSDGSNAPCSNHTRNAAVASCGRCGAFICGLCRIDSDAQVLCPGCFDRLAGEGALPSVRKTIQDHSRKALHVSMLGIIFMVAGLAIGPIAIFQGMLGLRQHKELGNRISRAKCIIAIILGSIEMVVGSCFIAAMAGAFR